MVSLIVCCHLRYTPSEQGMAYNSGAKQRVIRMVEAQRDPMEPPRFKYVSLYATYFISVVTLAMRVPVGIATVDK